MIKVIYNASYGGFCLSQKAINFLKSKGLNVDEYGFINNNFAISRHNAILVECIEIFGPSACSEYSVLKIKKVKNLYRITEYDGYETVETPESINWIDGTKN